MGAAATAPASLAPAKENPPGVSPADVRKSERAAERRPGESAVKGSRGNRVAKPEQEQEQEQGREREREEEARWRPVLGLPCQLTVDLPLPNFRVADFLGLRRGSIIATGWRLTRDVPLRVNGTLIGWGEFEGAGKRLGIRVTELA